MSCMQYVVADDFCILIALLCLFIHQFPHLKMIIVGHTTSLWLV